MNLPASEFPEITTAKARFWIWLIPLTALVAGGWLLWQHYAQRGILITVSFETAAGLVPGKTQLRFKDLAIGTLENIDLAPDLSHISARIRVHRTMQHHITESSRFWVVRPRIDKQGISGLNTLLSGAYIAIEPGPGKPATSFVGLENPPLTPSETPGLRLVLETESGGLDVGAPIYYRKIQVGAVEALTVSSDQQRIFLDIFVRSPYDAHISRATRFWRETGVDFSLSAEGIRLRTESLESLLSGGIAFDNPDPEAPRVKNGTHFPLFPNFREIQSRSMQMGLPFVVYFDGSVRGLSPGAPVDFRGVQIGEVLDVNLYYDQATQALRIPVRIAILTRRLTGPKHPDPDALFMQMLHQGLKARLEMGSLLTGQLFVAMEMDPANPVKELPLSPEGIPVIPTLPHPIAQLTENALRILNRIRELPLEGIAQNTITTLESARKLMLRMEDIPGDLRPVFQDTREVLAGINTTLDQLNAGLATLQQGSPLYMEINRAAQELAESARAIRILAESLEARPDTLLYGK
ncbi:intermembrane transport protein PqiB [Desulfobotulus sp.]|jgi:paraquat-inducible protein B|uniref:PqiB family protein n=1 Tax=Desulfobotulus sp. TaxID=1940337 RepID=UPI002A35E6B2|nr:MlaD family protein [Desulfobotulus sp.]MDY0162032.1 MlaD family protein [Desulfobotulus sp.]